MKNKRAAMEMSTGTIIVIVLSVLVLVFGSIFVKNIMCSGIIMTDQISRNTENQIKDLFGARTYGVKCMGTEGDSVRLGTGGTRQIFCVLNADEQKEYELKVIKVESIKGASTNTVQNWIKTKDWKGFVSPGNPSTQVILILDVPKQAPVTALRIEIEANDLTSGSKTSHTSYIDIEPVGAITATIC